MSDIKEIRVGTGSALEFISDNNFKSEIFVDNNGLHVNGGFTQRTITSIPCSSTINIDARLSNIFEIELTEDVISFNILNPSVGTYIVKVKQDSIGGWNITFGTGYLFEGGSAPNITATAEAVDVLSFLYDGENFIGSALQNFS